MSSVESDLSRASRRVNSSEQSNIRVRSKSINSVCAFSRTLQPDMAIPIGLPNSEDAEDSYRSLDLLLEQLLITLRQVLMHRRREAAAHAPTHAVRHRQVASEGTAVPAAAEEVPGAEGPEEGTRVPAEVVGSLPLPDVVLESSPECGAAQEAKETERTRTEVSATTTTTAQTHGWVQVGADLKRLADQLLTMNRLDQKDEKKAKLKDEKEAGLLSLLCPPLGGSVWTTVALLVGWGLLSRSR